MKSKQTRAKMSEAAKARCTSEWRLKQSLAKRLQVDEPGILALYQSGKTQAEVAAHFGIGRKVVENTMRRHGVKARKAAKRNQCGPANTGWKGEGANIVSKHRRLYRSLGQPSQCDECGTTDARRTYDWANMSGNYDDPADFKRLCRSCHWKYDKKHLNLRGKRCTTS